MLKEYLSTLANAFRIVLGTTDKINAQDFTDKVNEVYEAGKKSEYDAFWDAFQKNGNRTSYSGSPFKEWPDAIFKPKYDLRPVGAANGMFGNTNLTDVAKLLEEAGVVLDTSKATSMSEFASYYTEITRLPEISTIGCDSLAAFMYNTPYLHTIDKLILRDDGSQVFNSNSFIGSRFANVVVEGVVGTDIWLTTKALTSDSIKSFINALKDYSDTKTTMTVTLGTTNLAKLTNEEKAIATQKGWTLA